VLFRVNNVDIVFIHRECAPIGPPVFEWIIAKILRKRIIFDFDDAIWLPNTSKENAVVRFFKWHSKTKSICKLSHRVSCGNAYLAEYASPYNKHVRINPTTIDTVHLHNPERHQITRDSGVTTIGWTGTHSTLKYLKLVEGVIQKLSRQYTIRFLVIANKKPTLNIDALEFIEWNRGTEIEDLLKFDIGVMPLTDDIWAKGKCGFKALQYMSLGIPTIASPVGVNTTIIENHVDGFLCDKEEEWLNTVALLIENTALRVRVGQAAIEKVNRNYSVTSNADNFLRLFTNNQ
jgi:glycosyltransferase involved in cell wall biosynthesis